MTKIAMVCGGTAGHINPALAIAETLEQLDPEVEILFIGRAEGMEQRMIAKTSYPYKAIAASPLYFNPKALYRMVRDLFRGSKEAKQILRDFKPDAVVATGGYVCAPVFIAAHKLGIPSLIHEANAFAGRANRLLGARADTVCVSFEETKEAFPKAKKIVLTGNPVRPDFLEVDSEAAYKEIHQADPRPVVLISGGSQGAKSLCDATIDAAKRLIKDGETDRVRLVLSTGRKQYADIKAEAEAHGLDPVLELHDFIYNMDTWMAGSDLLVSRAGAISCSEIAALGRPSILVPYPYAAEDHQTKNAKAFVRIGAAKLVPDAELTGAKLETLILSLLNDPKLLEYMGEQAKTLAEPKAAEKIAGEVLFLAGGAHA